MTEKVTGVTDLNCVLIRNLNRKRQEPRQDFLFWKGEESYRH